MVSLPSVQSMLPGAIPLNAVVIGVVFGWVLTSPLGLSTTQALGVAALTVGAIHFLR